MAEVQLTVTGEAVWQALQNDPQFRQQYPAVQALFRPFVEAMPEVLADWLDKPVTFGNTYKAVNAYSWYLFTKGFHFKKAWIERRFNVFLHIKDLLKAATTYVLGLAMAANPEAALSSMGMTDAEMMLHKEIDLNQAAREGYQKGGYTIGQLMVDNPAQFCGLDDVLHEIKVDAQKGIRYTISRKIRRFLWNIGVRL